MKKKKEKKKGKQKKIIIIDAETMEVHVYPWSRAHEDYAEGGSRQYMVVDEVKLIIH